MRYILTVQKIPREARDEFRRLESPETYFEIRPGEVGQRVAYAVEMTEQEVERARRGEADPSSNLIALEPVRQMTPHSVPGVAAVNFLAMQGAVGDSQLNGHGVDVGVLDNALGPGAASQFSVKASRGYDSGGNLDDAIRTASWPHGTWMASLATPPAARLVFGGSDGYFSDELVALMYWMVDTVGVDILSMSWGDSITSTAQDDATSHAASQNVILFASRGNGGNSNPQYPAHSPGVRAISAYDTRTGRVTNYSSYGEVWAATAGDVVNWIDQNGSETNPDAHGVYGGTSSATALASHVTARLMTGGRSPGNVADYLANHARRTASPLYEGHGVLQLDAAANQILRDKPQKKNLDGTPDPGGGQDGCLAEAVA